MDKYYQVNIQVLGLDGEELVTKEFRFDSLDDFGMRDTLAYELAEQAKDADMSEPEDLRTEEEINFGKLPDMGDMVNDNLNDR